MIKTMKVTSKMMIIMVITKTMMLIMTNHNDDNHNNDVAGEDGCQTDNLWCFENSPIEIKGLPVKNPLGKYS